ncbi:MAG: 50S ribosomal protein L9 [Parachlamydia sp.]|nr:50S ribosomal protein L9 [Parachlamydia sp.]
MANKLLLMKDVDDLGRSGDIVTVKPGFARNFLLPQGFAVLADKRALKMQARLQEERRQKAVEDKQEAEELAAAIEGVTIETMVKVDHEGHMYGSVSAHDVADLLEKQISRHVDKKAIQNALKHPIKETGVFPIAAKLKEGITATFTLKVVPEEHHA